MSSTKNRNIRYNKITTLQVVPIYLVYLKLKPNNLYKTSLNLEKVLVTLVSN